MSKRIISTSVVHTCKSCGGNMTYHIESKKMICSSCDSKQSITITRKGKHAAEYSIDNIEEGEKLEAVSVIVCKSCGGETILNGYETSTKCEYCGNEHTVLHTETGLVKPETMIPFKITKDTAVESYQKWMKKHIFAPFGMRKNAKHGNLTGFYSPFWDYDFKSDIKYKGKRGTAHYRKTKNGMTRTVSWRSVEGRVKVLVDDEFTSGSKKYSKVLAPIKFYDFSDLVAYNPSLLAGFHSEKYSIDVYKALEIVKKNLQPEFERYVRNDIGGDEQRITAMDIDYLNIKYRHTLLPVWVSSYSFRDKTYEFAVNGQTGKVVGKAPVSILKIAILLVLIAVGYLVFREIFITPEEIHFP